MAVIRAKTLRIFASIAMACLCLVVAADPVGATPFYWRNSNTGCGPVNSADSASHGYWYSGDLTHAMAAATDWARANNVDPTDITTFSVPTLAFDTDVPVYDQNYSSWCDSSWHPQADGLVGLSQCVSLATNPAGACEKNDVRHDESFTSTASLANQRGLACHENGHTLGLGHPLAGDSESCVKTGYPKPLLNYSTHEVSVHINPNY